MSEYQMVALEDVDDWLGDYPGEMRGITYAIGAEQVAITYRRMPQHTGSKGSYGHRHKTQEEIYFVVSGKLQFKFGNEVVELGKHQAVRVPPETWRGVWNDEPEDAELIIVSARIDDPSADGEVTDDDFWPSDITRLAARSDRRPGKAARSRRGDPKSHAVLGQSYASFSVAE